MYRHLTILMLLLSLLIAACTPVVTPATPAEPAAPTAEVTEEPTEEPIEEAETEDATVTATATVTTAVEATEGEAAALSGCPEPTADTQLISSPAAGYCFLIPATFARSEFSDAEGFNLGIYGSESTPGHRERAFVNVTEATTQTLEGSVQGVIDEVTASLPGFTPTQTTLTLDGVPAVQFDNLPGQDINRKVYALYEGRLYELIFVPFEAERPDATAEAEQLYTLMLEGFSFIPTTATATADSDAALLTWEGEIDGACHTLTIQDNGEAAVAACDDAPTSTSMLDAQNGEWAAIQQHFGSIDATTPAGEITFQGQGNATNDLWAQALATWASFTAMDLNAGRTSASARTILAWQITDTAEHSGQCSHLIVLAYGYAYANLIPCAGDGPSTQIAAGWLTGTELDTLYEWVATGARVEEEAGYLDVQGSTPISPEEVTTWASAIYARLIQ